MIWIICSWFAVENFDLRMSTSSSSSQIAIAGIFSGITAVRRFTTYGSQAASMPRRSSDSSVAREMDSEGAGGDSEIVAKDDVEEEDEENDEVTLRTWDDELIIERQIQEFDEVARFVHFFSSLPTDVKKETVFSTMLFIFLLFCKSFCQYWTNYFQSRCL